MCNKICKNSKIELNSKKILIRKPKLIDLRQLLELVNSLIKEDAQIGVNKKYTLKEEKSWLKNKLIEIKKNNCHLIVAESNKEIIGSVEIRKGRWRSSHIGILGINVKRNYRGIGLGKALMKIAINIAKKDPKIKILRLEVYKTNQIAMKLYKKIGFRKVAELPKTVFWKNNYVNAIVMDYPLRKI